MSNVWGQGPASCHPQPLVQTVKMGNWPSQPHNRAVSFEVWLCSVSRLLPPPPPRQRVEGSQSEAGNCEREGLFSSLLRHPESPGAWDTSVQIGDVRVVLRLFVSLLEPLTNHCRVGWTRPLTGSVVPPFLSWGNGSHLSTSFMVPTVSLASILPTEMELLRMLESHCHLKGHSNS